MKPDTPHLAVYVRVSSRQQDYRSQLPDLERWLGAHALSQSVKWYRDTQSGQTMDRREWKQLEDDLHAGKVSKLIVWRIDRLGRTAAGLTSLFETLQRLGVGFESIKDRIDLSTPSGRLMAHVLASVAAYENEVRGERIRAGQAAARAQGKRWGGSKAGRRKKISAGHEQLIQRLRSDGIAISQIARMLQLSRPAIYSVVNTIPGTMDGPERERATISRFD